MNVAKYSGYVKPSLVLILNGLYCDTIFVTKYYGVARWTSSNELDELNNSLKYGRRINDNTHSCGNRVSLACAERTHTVCTLHRHLTPKLCTVDCQPVIHAQRVCCRPICLPSTLLPKLQDLVSVFLEDVSKRNKEDRKRRGWKFLILDKRVTFVNENHQIPLCTMLTLSTKPIHCRRMSTSPVCILYFDRSWYNTG